MTRAGPYLILPSLNGEPGSQPLGCILRAFKPRPRLQPSADKVWSRRKSMDGEGEGSAVEKIPFYSMGRAAEENGD